MSVNVIANLFDKNKGLSQIVYNTIKYFGGYGGAGEKNWGLIYKTVRGIDTKSVCAHKSRKWRMQKKIQIYKTVRTHT